MTHLDILVPFALPAPQLIPDLLPQLNMPALAMLLARGQRKCEATTEAFPRCLPHEAWLATQLGWEAATRQHGSPPLAAAAMRELGVPADTGLWFIINPIHLHVARDHLVLTDLRHLEVDEAESRALYDVARPLFEEVGHDLLWGNARTWFARADEWNGLMTSSPDTAAGRNIDVWMPQGEGERAWRKLQNEVQMHWFSHAVNQEREARGEPTINSLWLWGACPAGKNAALARYMHAFNLPSYWRGLPSSDSTEKQIDTVIASAPQPGLLVLETLVEAGLANDWSLWLTEMQALETGWFAPLLDALKSGKLGRISLIFTDHERLSICSTSRTALWKFWIKPDLAPLLAPISS